MPIKKVDYPYESPFRVGDKVRIKQASDWNVVESWRQKYNLPVILTVSAIKNDDVYELLFFENDNGAGCWYWFRFELAKSFVDMVNEGDIVGLSAHIRGAVHDETKNGGDRKGPEEV